MLKIWTLIVFAWNSDGEFENFSTVSFETEQACIATAALVNDKADESLYSIETFCVQAGLVVTIDEE